MTTFAYFLVILGAATLARGIMQIIEIFDGEGTKKW